MTLTKDKTEEDDLFSIQRRLAQLTTYSTIPEEHRHELCSLSLALSNHLSNKSSSQFRQSPHSSRSTPPPRKSMPDEITSTNPYSRLLALQRLGLIKNYSQIRQYTIIVVGIGGIGSLAAEMLCRCGIGKLILYDYDRVEMANMNRLFYRPEHVGMTKTCVAKQTLESINPDVEIVGQCADVTNVEGFENFLNELRNGGKSENGNNGMVTMVLSCVDNYTARVAVNTACNELGIVWMESGVSENAMSGHVQFIEPGRTACFCCVPPLVVANGIDERTLNREGVCAASLSTTMGIVAGLLVQNCLKWLLGFGNVTEYIGYNALEEFFPKTTLKSNVSCSDRWCRKRQRKYRETQDLEKNSFVFGNKEEKFSVGEQEILDLHPVNDWGIEVEEREDTMKERDDSCKDARVSNGLRFEFSEEDTGKVDAGKHVEANSGDIDDLIAQLSSQ